MSILLPSLEYLLEPYKNGVRLIKPFHQQSPLRLASLHSLYSLPCNVGFMNTDIAIVDINEVTAKHNGFLSPQDARGKTAFDVTRKKEAEMLVQHDKAVVQHQQLYLYEESYIYGDNQLFRCVALKLPWYAEDGTLQGLFFLGIHNFNNNLNQASEYLSKLSSFRLPKIGSQLKLILKTVEIQGVSLTTRETETLYFLIRGKRPKEIGNILGISSKTVESYIKILREKLGGITTSDLIALAVDSDFVNIVPESLLRQLDKDIDAQNDNIKMIINL